jgi:hypothetical protein
VSFLDSLKKSLSDEVVITHHFLLEYNPASQIVHAFFEGKTDESFYGTFIRRLKPSGWKLCSYVCGNKDSVYYHCKKLSSKHRKNQPILFFVDKDIEDIIPYERKLDEKIFVTSYYSVENYVVSSEMLEQVYSEIFRQSSGTKESEMLVETFKVAHGLAQDQLKNMMTWVLAHRRQGSRPNLDCIVTKELFNIDDNLRLTFRQATLDELIQLLDGRTKVETLQETRNLIAQCKTELEKYQPKEVIRGHNEMDFFIQFIKKLKQVVARESGNKIKANIEITKGNVLDLLGPRVPMPERLSEFLKKHLGFEKNLMDENEALTMP